MNGPSALKKAVDTLLVLVSSSEPILTGQTWHFISLKFLSGSDVIKEPLPVSTNSTAACFAPKML